jgi:hypothetical protein
MASLTRRCLAYYLILAFFAKLMCIFFHFHDSTVLAEFGMFNLLRGLSARLHVNAVATIIFALNVEIELAVNAL